MWLGNLFWGAIAVLVVWVMWPHARRGEFIAPNPIAPNTWMSEFAERGGYGALATPPQGFGFRRYDAWNHPPLGGRPATREDFELRW